MYFISYLTDVLTMTNFLHYPQTLIKPSLQFGIGLLRLLVTILDLSYFTLGYFNVSYFTFHIRDNLTVS